MFNLEVLIGNERNIHQENLVSITYQKVLVLVVSAASFSVLFLFRRSSKKGKYHSVESIHNILFDQYT